jgi:hypothetical protein
MGEKIFENQDSTYTVEQKIQQIKSKQNLSLGILCSSFAALISASIWGVIILKLIKLCK